MTIQETAAGLQPEAALDLTGFGSRPKWEGWFAGVILSEYSTQNGYTFRTEDTPAREGKRGRNLRLAVKVRNKAGEERNISGIINYDPADLTAARVAAVNEAVKEAQEKYNSAKAAFAKTNNGSSKGFPRRFSEFLDKTANVTQMSYARLGNLQKSVKGFTPTVNGSGGLTVSALINEAVDVRLGTDENGYATIEEIAPAKSHKETR